MLFIEYYGFVSSNLVIKTENKKGFYTLKIPNHEAVDVCEKAAKACPVKIITVKEI